MNQSVRGQYTMSRALLIGVGVGVSVLFLYSLGGVVVARWDVANVLIPPTLDAVSTYLLLSAYAIAVFAIPITSYLRFGVVSPVVALAVVLIGWSGFGLAVNILLTTGVFSLGYYAIGLTPLYLAVYVILGGIEYYVQSELPLFTERRVLSDCSHLASPVAHLLNTLSSVRPFEGSQPRKEVSVLGQ